MIQQALKTKQFDVHGEYQHKLLFFENNLSNIVVHINGQVIQLNPYTMVNTQLTCTWMWILCNYGKTKCVTIQLSQSSMLYFGPTSDIYLHNYKKCEQKMKLIGNEKYTFHWNKNLKNGYMVLLGGIYLFIMSVCHHLSNVCAQVILKKRQYKYLNNIH